MAVNFNSISIYTGFYSSKVEALNLTIKGLSQVLKWTVIDQDKDNYAVLYSYGENTGSTLTNPFDAMYYKVLLTDKAIRFLGYQDYNVETRTGYSYGLEGRFFAVGQNDLIGDQGVIWVYGNLDWAIIINKSVDISQSPAKIVTTLVYIGKFLPTYNCDNAKVLGKVSTGSNVILKVSDASKFEVNRQYIISDSKYIQKVTVLAKDTGNNTITVDQISYPFKENSQKLDDGQTIINPILISEFPKPYIVADFHLCDVNCLINNLGQVDPTLPGDESTATSGAGEKLTLFLPDNLVSAASIDKLNNDRYLFEIYLIDGNEASGFYGKFGSLFAVGSQGLEPENTVLDDGTWLYRVFAPTGLIAPYAAVKERSKS